MRENAEQRAVEEQLARIAAELKQIKLVLVVLVVVSPVGLYCIGRLIDALGALGVLGFWIALAGGAGYVVLLCLSRLTGLHKTLELKQDELARILKERGQSEGGLRT